MQKDSLSSQEPRTKIVAIPCNHIGVMPPSFDNGKMKVNLSGRETQAGGRSPGADQDIVLLTAAWGAAKDTVFQCLMVDSVDTKRVRETISTMNLNREFTRPEVTDSFFGFRVQIINEAGDFHQDDIYVYELPADAHESPTLRWFSGRAGRAVHDVQNDKYYFVFDSMPVSEVGANPNNPAVPCLNWSPMEQSALTSFFDQGKIVPFKDLPAGFDGCLSKGREIRSPKLQRVNGAVEVYLVYKTPGENANDPEVGWRHWINSPGSLDYSGFPTSRIEQVDTEATLKSNYPKLGLAIGRTDPFLGGAGAPPVSGEFAGGGDNDPLNLEF